MRISSFSHLKILEAESIHIIREVAGQFEKPVMLYSIGKDSSVLLRLVEKAFYPGSSPFPLLHIDTGFKFREMYSFRDSYAKERGFNLTIFRNEDAITSGSNPFSLGTQRCCGLLKTKALLDGLIAGGYDAAIGGARRDEERSRSKERIFSFRSRYGEWDPKNQRPELWNLYNGKIHRGESMRVYPISNWTELDVWQYIYQEQIPIVPLYFAKKRKVILRGEQLIPLEEGGIVQVGEIPQEILCRFRSLGCHYCTGAIRSSATTVAEIIAEMFSLRTSERSTRIIDHDSDGSMETKKREGYF
jgi:sulfate adenylyltransferase subunit 2